VFNDLKRSLESDGPISLYWAARAELEYKFIARSIFGGVSEGESYVLITSCSDIIYFLKSSKSDPTIELVFDNYQVEPEYRSVTKSLSGRGPKGESDASIVAESEIADLLRWLKLIRRSDSSMIAIRV
jgi:hypothetical protein